MSSALVDVFSYLHLFLLKVFFSLSLFLYEFVKITSDVPNPMTKSIIDKANILHATIFATFLVPATSGPEKAEVLPIFHALTGCDTVSFFNGRGKKSAFDSWNAYPEATCGFKVLLNRKLVEADTFIQKFIITMYKQHYIGNIIGKKGITKSRIENDTKCDIKIPKQGQNGDIVVLGPSVSNVKAARRRIDMIVLSARMKQRPTHFISIPMNSSEIARNFEKFKEDVLKECPDRGIEESVFIRASKLHITLGVMCLMDNEERLFASKLLTEAKEKVLMPILQGHLPLRIRLKGLSYMNDDPHEIDVLYGKVYEEAEASRGVLQRLADELMQYFIKSGYMGTDHGREQVKLHVTLINSKYRNEASAKIGSGDVRNSHESRSLKKHRENFNGTNILKKFSDYDFGVADLGDLHISQCHSIGSDGYYEATFVMNCC